MNSALLLFGFPCLALAFSLYLLPNFLPKLLKANLGGFDLNKPREAQKEKTPEAAGIVALISFSVFTPFLSAHYRIPVVTAGILGFLDNVVNLEWRWKLVIPFLSLLEMAVTFTARNTIVIETNFGDLALYKWLQIAVIFAYTIFCYNAINIYAGINGLEVSQSIVLMASLAVYVRCKGAWNDDFAQLALVFIAVSIALLRYNKFPARAFVGDVFTYFAGAAYAAAALSANCFVLSCFLLFMQLINFGASLPYLIGVVECPRHRLLRLENGLLYGQKKNWNIINQYLLKIRKCGMSEAQLLKELIIIQAVGSVVIVSVALLVK